MVLSVFQTVRNKYVLYDGASNTFLMIGKEDEMYWWKDQIERAEKELQDNEHKKSLIDKYTKILIEEGNSHERATKFLQSKMPKLFL